MAAQTVSVILPVHNGQEFVEAALRSIQTQNADIEVLVHDDGSTDDTGLILDRIARHDRRIVVSRTQNSGPAAARNHCLSRAKGDVIAFMDHDDIWPGGRLARQLGILARATGAAGVLGHAQIFRQADGAGSPLDAPPGRRVLAGLLQAGLFRRGAIALAGRFDTSLRAADDFDFLLRLIEAGGRLAIDPEIAVFYRQHAGQWTANLARTGLQTAKALRKSLERRRRAGGVEMLSWRLDDV